MKSIILLIEKMFCRVGAWLVLVIFIMMTGDAYSAPHRLQLVNLTAVPALVTVRCYVPSDPGTYVENPVYVMGNQTSFHDFDAAYSPQYEVIVNDGVFTLSWTDVYDDRLHLVYWNDSAVYNRLGYRVEKPVAGVAAEGHTWSEIVEYFTYGFSIMALWEIAALALLYFRYLRRATGSGPS